jgi:hypothetical protein
MPSHGAQDGSMSARDSDCARLGVKPFIKRCPNGEDPTARPALCLEDHDGQSGLAKQIGGAQPGKAGSHDDRRIAVDRARARAERDGSEGSGPRGLLEKAPPVHGVIIARLATVSTDDGAPFLLTSRREDEGLRQAQGVLRTAVACRNYVPRFVTFRTRVDQRVVPSTSVQRDPHPGYLDDTDRITVIAAMRTSARS